MEKELVQSLANLKTHQRFPEEATMHYTYPSIERLLENQEDLQNMVNDHMKNQVPRLQQLQDYYEGNNTTVLRNKRRREERLSDHRATHAFGEGSSGFIQGFMVGIPLKTEYPDDAINEKIRDLNRINDADEHNSELVLDQSIFGRAYEIVYRSQSDETRFTKLDVKQTFIIYDDTVEQLPIAGVRYFKNRFTDNETIIYLYTSTHIHQFKLNGETQEGELEPHAFGGVPIVEYSNNRFRRGDFEKVLDLIDLYDESQSDTANYMTDLNDAMLVIQGRLDLEDMIDEDEEGEEGKRTDALDAAQRMKDANILYLVPPQNADGREGNVSAEYIYKKYDVEGTEKYKDRIKDDIHMFTYTPNMDDGKFAGNQSGESLKYKLFGLDQKRATKERFFKKSLRNRYRLIASIMNLAAEGSFDVNDLTITFTPNLPKSIKDEIQAFVDLGGELSTETKLRLLSIIENPQEEMDKIDEEKAKNPLIQSPFPFPEEQEVTDDE